MKPRLAYSLLAVVIVTLSITTHQRSSRALAAPTSADAAAGGGGGVAANDGDDDYHYEDEYEDDYGDDGGDNNEAAARDVGTEDQSHPKPADSDGLSDGDGGGGGDGGGVLSATTTKTTTTASVNGDAADTGARIASDSSTNTTTTTTNSAMEDSLWSDEDNEVERYPCPEECSCEDGTRFLNCSHRALADIPAELPPNVIRLDLSDNNIKHIPEQAFRSCAASVREILLGGNAIEELPSAEEAATLFAELIHLDVLTLERNRLTRLDPGTFTEAQSLRRLDLSENPLELPTEGPFLRQPDLEELELARCNLTELGDEVFSGLAGLKALNLAGNEFDEDLSTNVFEPLINLQRLHLPPLSEDAVRDLCDVVKSIDVVDITSHNISCFYLASETSYEDSIITQPPPTTEAPKHSIPVAKSTARPARKQPKTEEDASTTTTTTSRTTSATAPPPDSASRITTKTPSVLLSGGPSSASITHAGDIAATSTSTTSEGRKDDGSATAGAGAADDSSQSLLASISTETMKELLMGLIGAGIVLLILGLICRRTGLKNKLCGTKRRPAPTDQVRPAEEVPLNKV